ncbi:hypothetical protein [Neorhizobium galegae]|uniref:hypothetical protein n=1 Tax=Neorhizobium galegae TaxID=399 RepID=UPI001F16990B|nr:hypothetical protein [Neorhizobium galegae]UIK05158.1 hypothetical protein LZK81_21305 [Neorhizobium galegae]
MKLVLAVMLFGMTSQAGSPFAPVSGTPLIQVAAPADVPRSGMFDRNHPWPEDAIRLYKEAAAIEWETKPSEAVEAYRQVLAHIEDFPQDLRESLNTRYMTASIRTWIASLLTRTKRFSEAWPELEQARKVADDLLLNWGYSFPLVSLSRVVRTRTADLQLAIGASEAAAQSALEAMDLVAAFTAERPDDEELQSELAMTMLYAAESARMRGATAEAQTIARRLIEVRLLLLQSHPADVRKMRDASSAHILIGELSREFGKLDEAKSAFLAALQLRQQVERRNPGPRSSDDLLPVYSSLVNLARQQIQWDEVKTYAKVGLTTSRSILQKYPGKAGASESVAVFLTMLAEWEEQQDDLAAAEKYLLEALSLRKAAARSFTLDARSQRSLHVAFNRIGDIYRQQKRLPEAREAIESAKQISVAMIERDPTNLSLQRDLSVSYNRLGDCYLDEGLSNKALENYRDGLRIRRSIADIDKGSVAAKLDVVRSLGMVGDAAKSETEYREALAILDVLKANGNLPKVNDEWFDWIHQRIEDLKAK